MTKPKTSDVVPWSLKQWTEMVTLLKRLIPLPSLADSAQVRDWVRHVVELAGKFENQLPELINRGINLLAEIAASDAVWTTFYKLLASLSSAESAVSGSLDDVLALRYDPQVECLLHELADKAADEAANPALQTFDLTLILQIIAAIIQLLNEQQSLIT